MFLVSFVLSLANLSLNVFLNVQNVYLETWIKLLNVSNLQGPRSTEGRGGGGDTCPPPIIVNLELEVELELEFELGLEL